MPEEGAAKCFAYVQTYDTKPKRRLFELMKSQGLQANQQVTFLSDGADDVRELPLYLSPESEHWLDWFHVAMRLRVMGQMAKGLRNEQNMTPAHMPPTEDAEEELDTVDIGKELEPAISKRTRTSSQIMGIVTGTERRSQRPSRSPR